MMDLTERYLNPYTDFGFNKQEIDQYEESLKVFRDLNNVIDTAEEKGLRKGLAQGRAEGRAEGLAEGMEKGLTEGMEKGKVEGEKRKQLEIARNMKQAGMPVEQITLFTGLPAEEINEL